MPVIDVADLLTDPDLGDTFTVIRRLQAVGANGVVTNQVATYPGVVGVVGPTGDSSLQRLTDAQLMGKSVQVVTAFRLRGPAAEGALSWAPDLIVWPEGTTDTYVVADLQDYSRYGRGFVVATCATTTYVPAPPSEDPLGGPD